MEPSCEELWTSAELRKHETLTLSSDVSILKCMQKISAVRKDVFKHYFWMIQNCLIFIFQNIVSKTNAVMRELDSLEKETTTASITVENCIQNLSIMSSKQYVEKRVYDEEVVEKKEVLNSAKLSSDSIDIIPKVREALSYGLPAVKTLGDDTNSLSQEDTQRNCYSNRSLPILLGSEAFPETPSVGTITETTVSCSNNSLSSLKIPSVETVGIDSNTILPSSEQSPEIIPTVSPQVIPNLSPQVIPNISPEFSPKHFPNLSPNVSPKSLPIPKLSPPTNNNINSIPLDSESQENKELSGSSAPTTVQSQPNLVSNLHAELAARFRGASVGERSTATSTENPDSFLKVEDSKIPVVQPLKKKNLFDESSDSDGDDLFKVDPGKSILPSNLKSAPPINSQISNNIIPATNSDFKRASNAKSLFEDSDSEEDIFAPKTSSGNVKESKTQSLFDDDDTNDDDLLNWMPSRTSKKNTTLMKNDPIGKPLPTDDTNRTSLFEDSDSDGDLFSTGPPTPVPSRPFVNEKPVRKLLKVLPDLRIATEISDDPSELRMSFDYDSPIESTDPDILPSSSAYLKTSSVRLTGSMSPFRATPSPLADDNNLLRKVASVEIESPPIGETINGKDFFKESIDSSPEAESINQSTGETIGAEDLLKVDDTPEMVPTPEVDSTPTSLIASLKLSLSKQPNGPNFSTPSLVSPDVKPFGGVSLFSPISPITPSASSNASSDPVEDTEDSESLPCVAKNRPRAPNKRRPQSRNHRRSMILEEEALHIDVNDQ